MFKEGNEIRRTPPSVRPKEAKMRRIEAAIDARMEVERIVSSRKTTDVEAAFIVLSCSGWSDAEICRHFEWSPNRAQTIKTQIREKHS